MTSEQFFFAAIISLQKCFSGHVPSNFFYSIFFFGRGGGRGVVKIGSICVSP